MIMYKKKYLPLYYQHRKIFSFLFHKHHIFITLYTTSHQLILFVAVYLLGLINYP